MNNETFFVDLLEQHRDAHKVLGTAIREFAEEHWETVGSRDPKPTWAPMLWLVGWDIDDTDEGPIIHAAFVGDYDEHCIFVFPAKWLDYFPGSLYIINEEMGHGFRDYWTGKTQEDPQQPAEGRKYGHLTVIK